MAESKDWLETLYLKDLVEFLRSAFSRLFPKSNSGPSITEATQTEESTVLITQTLVSQSDKGGWTGFFKTWFAVLGASVFLVASPLLCGYVWHRFYASRLFVKKQEEISGGVVITGCDSGIGIETAAVLSASYPNMLVFAGCLTNGGIQKLSAQGRPNLMPVKVDVTSDSEVHTFVNVVRSRLGQKKLYAVVNNAGVFDGSFVEVTPLDTYARVMEVNFYGVVRVTKAFLPYIARGDGKKMDGGRIINVASLASMLTSPGNTVYCASKYAMSAFTDGLRQEIGELGIKVRCAFPQFVLTSIWQVIQIVPGPVRTGSLSQIPVSANALLSAGPEDVLQRFGGQPFLTAYARFFSDVYDQAVSPVSIARTIQKALIHRYPKDIYYEADQIFNVLSICPHFIRDFLLDLRSFRKQIMSKYVK